MARCVNENCNKDPSRSPNAQLYSTDGDFACSPECLTEARRQMDHFCSVTLKDDDKFKRWLFEEPVRGDKDG
jgi:hypothetical protein